MLRVCSGNHSWLVFIRGHYSLSQKAIESFWIYSGNGRSGYWQLKVKHNRFDSDRGGVVNRIRSHLLDAMMSCSTFYVPAAPLLCLASKIWLLQHVLHFLRVSILTPNKGTHDLLLSIQQQLSEMTEFEHRGFDNIASLSEEVASACKPSIRINIAPPLGDTQPREPINLPLVRGDLALILPFRTDCAITKTGVDVEALFNKDVICIDRADQLLRQFAEALQTSLAGGQ